MKAQTAKLDKSDLECRRLLPEIVAFPEHIVWNCPCHMILCEYKAELKYSVEKISTVALLHARSFENVSAAVKSAALDFERWIVFLDNFVRCFGKVLTT